MSEGQTMGPVGGFCQVRWDRWEVGFTHVCSAGILDETAAFLNAQH